MQNAKTLAIPSSIGTTTIVFTAKELYHNYKKFELLSISDSIPLIAQQFLELINSQSLEHVIS